VRVEEEDASFLLTDDPMDLPNVPVDDVEAWANLLPDSAASPLVKLTEAMAHLCDHQNTFRSFMESTTLNLEVHDHQIMHSQCQVGVPKLPSFLGSLLWGAVENTVSMVDELAMAVNDLVVNASGVMETAMRDEITQSVGPVCAWMDGLDEKAAHGEEAFQMLSRLQEMLHNLYSGFLKGDNKVDIKEMADRVAKLEQSVRVGATKKVRLSLILSGIDEVSDAPIEGMDDIREYIDTLERLQRLTEEQGFIWAQDGRSLRALVVETLI